MGCAVEYSNTENCRKQLRPLTEMTEKKCTVMIPSFRTPKTFVVITLKFELCGFTID